MYACVYLFIYLFIIATLIVQFYLFPTQISNRR